jgi:hypothetical protein
VPARLLRAAIGGFGDPFAVFERAEGPPVELLSSYRDAVKPGWRRYWWSTRVLLGLRKRFALPPDHEELALALLRARTLPADPREFAEAAAGLAQACPHR